MWIFHFRGWVYCMCAHSLFYHEGMREIPYLSLSQQTEPCFQWASSGSTCITIDGYNVFITYSAACQSLLSANHRHNKVGDLRVVAPWVGVGWGLDCTVLGCLAHLLLLLWWNLSLTSKLLSLLIRNDILCPGHSLCVTYAMILKNCCFVHFNEKGACKTTARWFGMVFSFFFFASDVKVTVHYSSQMSIWFIVAI